MYKLGLHDVTLFTLSAICLLNGWHDHQPLGCVVLEWNNHHHNLTQTITNMCSICATVIVISDSFIYPSIHLSNVPACRDTEIKLFEQDKLRNNVYQIGKLVSTFDHLLVLPDGIQINFTSREQRKFIDSMEELDDDNALLYHIRGDRNDNVNKSYIYFDQRRWTLFVDDDGNDHDLSTEYYPNNQMALLIKGSTLLQLPRPFERPFLQSFTIQSQLVGVRYKIVDVNIFFKHNHQDDRLEQKFHFYEEQRLIKLYHELGIKLRINADGSSHWFGCDRGKPRCFGTILNGMPDYLSTNRWLPPCCRQHLEQTGRYVFDILDKFGVRYWLEGGSLLGAARNGQIIDWDYDIDIGFYREDAHKMVLLQRMLNSSSGHQLEDGSGYVWEKAIEGDFIKVHYSRVNRIHVDLFPFYALNATMTKDTWLHDHRQDCPFPQAYLQPLQTIKFIGIAVSAPNNVKDFLEFKFGKGVIEDPRLPDGQTMEV